MTPPSLVLASLGYKKKSYIYYSLCFANHTTKATYNLHYDNSNKGLSCLLLVDASNAPKCRVGGVALTHGSS